MTTVETEYKGIPMAIIGEAEAHVPQRLTADPYYSTPEDGGWFEAQSVLVGSYDIIDLLDADILANIEERAYQEVFV